MDSRQVGMGALLLFLSSVVLLQTNLVESRGPIILFGLTALVVTVGAIVSTRRKPERI